MARTPAPKTRIQRAGNGHSYFLDGEKVPGVTTILGDGIPKKALIDWSAKMCAQFVVNRLQVVKTSDGRTRYVADDVVRDALDWNRTRERPERISNQDLDRLAMEKILKDIRYADSDAAAGRGTEVHGIAERLARGDEVDVPDYIAGHVDSYVKFLNDWNPTNAILEPVVVNRRYQYMGKLDLIADFDVLPEQLADRLGMESATGLLDVKTTRSGIYAETAMQTSAYRHCETMIVGYENGECIEAPMPKVDFIGAIWVRGDDYEVFVFDDGPEVFRTFLYAQQIARVMKWPDGPAESWKSAAIPPPSRSEVSA